MSPLEQRFLMFVVELADDGIVLDEAIKMLRNGYRVHGYKKHAARGCLHNTEILINTVKKQEKMSENPQTLGNSEGI